MRPTNEETSKRRDGGSEPSLTCGDTALNVVVVVVVVDGVDDGDSVPPNDDVNIVAKRVESTNT